MAFGQGMMEGFKEALEAEQKEIREKREKIRKELAERFQIQEDGELAKGIACVLAPWTHRW